MQSSFFHASLPSFKLLNSLFGCSMPRVFPASLRISRLNDALGDETRGVSDRLECRIIFHLPQTSALSKHRADGVIIKQNKHWWRLCRLHIEKTRPLSVMCERFGFSFLWSRGIGCCSLHPDSYLPARSSSLSLSSSSSAFSSLPFFPTRTLNPGGLFFRGVLGLTFVIYAPLYTLETRETQCADYQGILCCTSHLFSYNTLPYCL